MSLKNDLLSFVKGHKYFISYEGTYRPTETLLKFRDIPYCEYLVFRLKKGSDDGILFVAVSEVNCFHDANFGELAPTSQKCWWEEVNKLNKSTQINRENFIKVKEFYI